MQPVYRFNLLGKRGVQGVIDTINNIYNSKRRGISSETEARKI